MFFLLPPSQHTRSVSAADRCFLPKQREVSTEEGTSEEDATVDSPAMSLNVAFASCFGHICLGMWRMGDQTQEIWHGGAQPSQNHWQAHDGDISIVTFNESNSRPMLKLVCREEVQGEADEVDQAGACGNC